MVAEGMAQRIGASGRQTVLAVFVGGFGLDCYGRNISDDLEKRIEVVWKAETACVRSAHTLRQDWRFHAGYGLLLGLDPTYSYCWIRFSAGLSDLLCPDLVTLAC